MMKIELRKFSHYPRLSQETDAFNADVYVDGVKRGTAKNDGHGGPNMIHPRELNDQIEAYAKTLPPLPPSPGMEDLGPLPMSGDLFISLMVGDMAPLRLQIFCGKIRAAMECLK